MVSGAGFSADGSLDSLLNAQRAVIYNENECTSFAMRHHNASILISFYKSDPMQKVIPTSIFRLRKTIFSLVGRSADCAEALRIARNYDQQYYQRTGLHIISNVLALSIADDFHDKSLHQFLRPLAYNTIIIGKESNKFKSANIFKVDVSGNFFRCLATSIGFLSDKINYWIRNKGIDLMNKLNINNQESNFNNEFNSNHTFLILNDSNKSKCKLFIFN